jgi:hypothetical protein
MRACCHLHDGCISTRATVLQILLKHVLGASNMGESAVQIWYVSSKTDSSGQSHRTSCSLRKTPALKCQSPQGAEKLVAAVRAVACASAGSKPHRVTAFINPISGKGRCAIAPQLAHECMTHGHWGTSPCVEAMCSCLDALLVATRAGSSSPLLLACVPHA